MTRMAASAVKDDERGIVGGGGDKWMKGSRRNAGNWGRRKGTIVGLAPFWLLHAERGVRPYYYNDGFTLAYPYRQVSSVTAALNPQMGSCAIPLHRGASSRTYERCTPLPASAQKSSCCQQSRNSYRRLTDVQ